MNKRKGAHAHLEGSEQRLKGVANNENARVVVKENERAQASGTAQKRLGVLGKLFDGLCNRRMVMMR